MITLVALLFVCFIVHLVFGESSFEKHLRENDSSVEEFESSMREFDRLRKGK